MTFEIGSSIAYRSPGQIEYNAITLERGVTHDPDFEAWANKVWSRAGASGEQQVSLADFRKDIIIELYNETGQKVIAYNVFRCWVSEYRAYNGVMSLRQIDELFFRGRGGSWPRERLRALAAHDLVRSPKPAERHLVPAGEQIYWLGKRVAEQVAGLQGRQEQAFPWRRTPRWSILQHDLAVNDFRKCGEARRYRPQCEHVWAWCACDMPCRTGGGQAGNKGLCIVYRPASPDLPEFSRKRRST